MDENVFEGLIDSFRGAVGAIASGLSGRFGITEQELLGSHVNGVMASNVFKALIDGFRRRRRRHCVGLVETIQNHQMRASETNFEPSYGPKRVSSRFGYADSVRLIRLGQFDSVSICKYCDFVYSIIPIRFGYAIFLLS